jgi:hypothetical protein
MTRDRLVAMKALEGHHVSLALRDGSRIDDCQLISTGRGQAGTLWLFATGADTFVDVDDVLDVWECAHRGAA